MPCMSRDACVPEQVLEQKPSMLGAAIGAETEQSLSSAFPFSFFLFPKRTIITPVYAIDPAVDNSEKSICAWLVVGDGRRRRRVR